MKIKIFIVFSFCLIYFNCSAQNEDFSKDSTFFKNQTKLYQRWLNHSGLNLIRVHSIEIKSNELSLYLTFAFEEIDSIVTAWKMLKTSYESSHSTTLEQELFYKMINLMEVPQGKAKVEICDTYSKTTSKLFSRAIYFLNGRVNVEELNPRSIIEELFLQPVDFKFMKSWSVLDLQQNLTKQVVFNKIYACASSRFNQKVCEYRTPKIRLLESQEVLRFEVTDLCREVLIDEANPLLCKILQSFGKQCNWVKREMLIFEITHHETPTGFQLKIELDGKYGSGLYSNVRRGGYLSMEIDFDDYLELYADGFREYLRQCLVK